MKNFALGYSTVLVLLTSYLSSCGHFHSNISESEITKNSSFHIMVNSEESIPLAGTFSWGPQYFKLNYKQEFDLTGLNERLRKAIRHEMKGKGFYFIESEEHADVLVGYAVALDAAIDELTFNQAYGDEFKLSFPIPEMNQELFYHHGALIIDVLDNKSKKLLWRGAVTADVKLNVREDKKKQRTQTAIKTLLESFPNPKVDSSGT